MPGPIRIRPSVQSYVWGDSDYLPELLGLADHDGPCAEAWFGTHPQAPAGVFDSDASLESVHGNGLPYLLKLLAAARPLSIQVHPNRAQAANGFAREEEAGIPRDDVRRCYRDPSPKPEILVALTPFDALCGFRRGDDLAAALAQAPELTSLVPHDVPRTPGALRSFLEAYFAVSEHAVTRASIALLDRLAEEDARTPYPEDSPAAWALAAQRELFSETHPDRGLLFVFMLEFIRLQPGQAVFLPAGVPHAYLRGAGLELMSSSDNVLRAGLTSKHVDAGELLRTVRYEAGRPPILDPIPIAGASTGAIEARYALPVAELDLRRFRLDVSDSISETVHGPQTLLCLGDDPTATVRIDAQGESIELRRGEACLLPHGTTYQLGSTGPVDVFVAGPPDPKARHDFRGRRPVELTFGTSGLRGLVDDITDLEAYVNTRGFLDFLVDQGDAVPGTTVALGGDLRPSTDSTDRSILRAVAQAVRDMGLDVVHCGRLPTPALTYFAVQNGWPSIMVTGSHIPFDRNGIKFNKSDGEVLKSDEAAILAAVTRVRALEYGRDASDSPFDDRGFFRPDHVGALPRETDSARDAFRARARDAFGPGVLEGLRIAFFEHSAVGRELIPEIFRELGAEVVGVGRSDTFVAIDTEAIADERLAELQRLADEVRTTHGSIDALVSTDGDSDRPLLCGIDDDGRVHFLGGDVLGLVVADALDADALAVPVSSNDAIERHLDGREVTITRTRIGSPWVIAAMNELDGERIVGWEANGGFLVGSMIRTDRGLLAPLPTRDAVLPVIAALDAARRAGVSLVELFGALPSRHSRAGMLDDVAPARSRALKETFGLGDPTLRHVGYGDDLVVTPHEGVARPATDDERARLLDLRERLTRHFHAERGFDTLIAVDVLDGIRLGFTNGDVAHVRPSGNAPQLRIYAVADTVERAEAIVAEGLREPDGLLRELLAAS